MFQKHKTAIGIEIGDGLVKAMHIVSTPKENKLIGFEMVDVNFREGRQGIVNAMKKVLDKLSLNKKDKVNISVSGESVMVRDIHWPQMTDEEIRKALKFEVERQVHYKAEEIVFDYYSVIDNTIVDTKTRVILVAAKKDLIKNYSSLIESAGYKCGFVEVDTFSLLNCFYVNGPVVPPEKTILIINVGLEVTNIDIIKGKIVGLTKDAFVAWSNLVDTLPEDVEPDFDNLTALKGLMGTDDVYELGLFIMNALSNQVRRTIEFYESQGRDMVEEIYLSGKLAMYKNLDKYLQNILGLKVTIWNPIANVSCNSKLFEEKNLKEKAPMLALCSGLACRRAFDIDLTADREAEQRSRFISLIAEHKALAYTAVAVLFFLAGLWVILLSQIKVKENRKKVVLSENQKLNEILKDIENLKQGRIILSEQMSVAKTLLSHRLLWSRKLYEISKSVSKEMWLKEIYINELSSSSAAREVTEKLGLFTNLSGSAQADAAAAGPELALNIKGVVYSESGKNLLGEINQFISNLNNAQGFKEDFDKIELKRSYRDTVGNTEIMNFSIECTLKR
ncbi:MAG: type IV pilus assembly protein PilM [Candidatus Omnitrophica bacterium]|nr:type IV pilus assembly protein PilM [Candidatus Omnitrophota bacterium]